MDLQAQQAAVQAASQEMRRRTLASIPRPLDRLIYLASLRDYNSGLYYHDGLASRFSEEVVCEALAECHREAFGELFSLPLEELVEQVEAYVNSTHAGWADFIAAWRGLEPYRVAVPVDTERLSAEFFFSNLKVSLAILEHRLRASSERQPGAWPRRSPAQ